MATNHSLLITSREHLREAREGYFRHLAFALLVSALLLAAAIACLVHALVPGLCRRSASQVVTLLVQLFDDRGRIALTARAASGPLTLAGLLLLGALPLGMMLASGAGLLALPAALLCLGIAAAYVRSNPDLEPVF